MCWDRELVIQEGWALESRVPLDLFSAGLCLYPALDTGYSMRAGATTTP